MFVSKRGWVCDIEEGKLTRIPMMGIKAINSTIRQKMKKTVPKKRKTILSVGSVLYTRGLEVEGKWLRNDRWRNSFATGSDRRCAGQCNRCPRTLFRVCLKIYLSAQ